MQFEVQTTGVTDRLACRGGGQRGGGGKRGQVRSLRSGQISGERERDQGVRYTGSSTQWRSQDFLKEGSEFHGGPRYPHQKLKTHRIWPTIFLEGAQFDELKIKEKIKKKEKCQFWGPIPGLERLSLRLSAPNV